MKRLLLLTVAFIAGCGSPLAPSSPPASPAAPVASTGPGSSNEPTLTVPASSEVAAASPTPVGPMTVEYAAKVYLAVATRYNKLSNAAYDKLSNDPTLAQWQTYYETYAEISRDFADRLRSRIWPPEAAADMKLLLRKNAEVALLALELSKADTVADFNHLYSTYEKLALQASGLANAVRTDLGLDPVPVE